MTDLRTRDVTHDDLQAILRIRTRSFGPLGIGGEQWWQEVTSAVIPGRMIAVVDASDTVLGTGRAFRYDQSWGGRDLPMGGVAGVYVEPSARGRGVARALMRGLITRMAELGDVVSCLFPTAPELYRSVGCEVGGTHHKMSYAAHDVRALRSLGGGLRPRPANPDDAELVHQLLREDCERHRFDGVVLPRVDDLRKDLGKDDSMHYLLDGSGGAPRGFVTYSLEGEALHVERLAAESPEALAALWGVVGSGSSAAPKVHSYLHPRHPGQLMLPAIPDTDQKSWTWMARIINLPDAVAARGFSPFITATADVVVEDPDVPANSGHWRLAASGGRATAELLGPVGASPAAYGDSGEPATLGPRGLAALWCGRTMSQLRQAGLTSGGSAEADAALDAVFAGTPHLLEYF